MKNQLPEKFSLLSILALTILASSCQPQEERATLITRLGNDTLALETIRLLPRRVEAEVVLRSPVTSYQKYLLEMGRDYAFRSFTESTFNPHIATQATPVSTRTVSLEGDSLSVRIDNLDGNHEEFRLPADASVLPFIDMVYWPFELALRKLQDSGRDSLVQSMFEGRRVLDFVLGKAGTNVATIQHPSRGISRVFISEEGALQRLDAAGTTRALTVERVDPLNMEIMAQRFATLDNTGRMFGPLSGRATTNAVINGAQISIDYGQPARRGRALFGALVPWNKRWRTGANRATHFQTDTPLQFSELTVPAGTYTLFTIPAPNGGTLIINKQTGQNGTVYNEDLDLGRVPLSIDSTAGNTELFTIAVEQPPGQDSSLLILRWGDMSFSTPFVVTKNNEM